MASRNAALRPEKFGPEMNSRRFKSGDPIAPLDDHEGQCGERHCAPDHVPGAERTPRALQRAAPSTRIRRIARQMRNTTIC